MRALIASLWLVSMLATGTASAQSFPFNDAGVLFYGTLDGWFKAADEATGKILYQFHAPSGIIGNPISYMYKGKEYVAVLSGVGGWAAIGLAEGLTKGTEGLGAVGLTTSLADYTNLGGTLVVFSLE